MQLETHPDCGGHHPPQQLHVTEHPLVPVARDPEVSLEQGVEANQEKLHRVETVVAGSTQSSSAQQRQTEAKGHNITVFT